MACAASADVNTLALFSIDPDKNSALPQTFTDVSAAKHSGSIQGLGGRFVASSQTSCGTAYEFSGSTTLGKNFAQVDDASAWQLAVGSVDLWVNFPAAPPGNRTGLFARDALDVVGTPALAKQAGRLTVFRACDGTIVARIKGTDGSPVFACSSAATTTGWTHVGVNFGTGGFELYVGATNATKTGDVGLLGVNCATKVTCASAAVLANTTVGLGNKDAWVIGASMENTSEGATNPVVGDLFLGGQIDSFRISKARRTTW